MDVGIYGHTAVRKVPEKLPRRLLGKATPMGVFIEHFIIVFISCGVRISCYQDGGRVEGIGRKKKFLGYYSGHVLERILERIRSSSHDF
jgi:hypothetical protein